MKRTAFISLCAFAVISVRAFAAISLERVELGVGGLVRAGAWTPFSVLLKSDEEPFEGTAILTLGEGEVASEFRLPAHGSALWESVARTGVLTLAGELRIRDSDSEETLIPIPFAPNVSPHDTAVLALTTERGTLAPLTEQPTDGWSSESPPLQGERKGVSTNDPRIGRFITREIGSVRELPLSPLGWSGIDAVVWHGPDPRSEAWSPERERALTMWIRQGGTFVYVDDGLESWRGSFLETFLNRADANFPGLRGNPGESSLLSNLHRISRLPTDFDGWRRVLGGTPPNLVRTWDTFAQSQRERLLDRLNIVGESTGGISPRTKTLAVSGLGWVIFLSLFAWWRWRFRWMFALVGVGVATAVPLLLRARTSEAHPREFGVIYAYPEARSGFWHGILSLPPLDVKKADISFTSDIFPTRLESGFGGTLTDLASGDSGGGSPQPTSRLEGVVPHRSHMRHWAAHAYVPFPGEVRATLLGDGVKVDYDLPLRLERGGVLHTGNRGGMTDTVEPGASFIVPTREYERRRDFWEALEIPAPVYAFWTREGIFDATTNPNRAYFVGWAKGVSAVGVQETAHPENLLLVILPLDIREAKKVGSEAVGKQGR